MTVAFPSDGFQGGSTSGVSVRLDRFDIVKEKAATAIHSLLPAAVSGRQYVLYTFAVEAGAASGGGSREARFRVRYRDVSELHQRLTQMVCDPKRALPPLPAKTTTRRFDGPFLQARASQLERYFAELCERPSVVALRPVQKLFFGVAGGGGQSSGAGGGCAGGRSSDSSPATSSHALPVQVAAVPSPGVVDFQYDPASGYLLVASNVELQPHEVGASRGSTTVPGVVAGSSVRGAARSSVSSLEKLRDEFAVLRGDDDAPPQASAAPGTSRSSSRAVSALTMWRARGGRQESEQLWSLSLQSRILAVASNGHHAFAGLESGEVAHRKAARDAATGALNEITHVARSQGSSSSSTSGTSFATAGKETRQMKDMFLPDVFPRPGETRGKNSASCSSSSLSTSSSLPAPLPAVTALLPQQDTRTGWEALLIGASDGCCVLYNLTSLQRVGFVHVDGEVTAFRSCGTNKVLASTISGAIALLEIQPSSVGGRDGGGGMRVRSHHEPPPHISAFDCLTPDAGSTALPIVFLLQQNQGRTTAPVEVAVGTLQLPGIRSTELRLHESGRCRVDAGPRGPGNGAKKAVAVAWLSESRVVALDTYGKVTVYEVGATRRSFQQQRQRAVLPGETVAEDEDLLRIKEVREEGQLDMCELYSFRTRAAGEQPESFMSSRSSGTRGHKRLRMYPEDLRMIVADDRGVRFYDFPHEDGHLSVSSFLSVVGNDEAHHAQSRQCQGGAQIINSSTRSKAKATVEGARAGAGGTCTLASRELRYLADDASDEDERPARPSPTRVVKETVSRTGGAGPCCGYDSDDNGVLDRWDN